MLGKLLKSSTLHASVIVFVMIAAGFVLLAQSSFVSAQATDSQLVVGLQNGATSLNFFDVATNSVWKAYMLEFNYEPLYTYDPDSTLYADLANNAPVASGTCPAGETPGPYDGMCHSADYFNFTVFLHNNITFADKNFMNNPKPLTADDVIFSYQTMGWSTNAQVIYPALWWPQPIAPLWNSTANGGSCAVPAGKPYACMSHVAVFKMSQYSVRFQLLPVSVPGQTAPGAYALFFYATLTVPIIPEYFWVNHINPSPQVNWSSSTGANVADTWDRSIDTSYSAMDDTVGTGPFYLDTYQESAQTVIKVFPNYWGKGLSHTWKGTAFGFFPAYITSVKFVIYTSLDVVSLALQQGSIDTLVWSLTPGFYSQVQSNPAITVTSVTDSGFFYMSFNMRRQPWDDLCLRQAISMAIDKNYIVNVLMGGFGVAGTVPISIVNPSYVNSSATPPAFDLAGIGPKLLACGYTQDAATGFWKAPAREGGQIVTATILTPPKDYDPVRADAGIMISKNLKSQGLDINSAPTSFDTIVSRGLTYGQVDYDIYVLGWSLGIFPETYICSFFCSNQDVQTNIAGSNSAGYANSTVDQLINQLTYTVNTNQRITLMQQVEGIVTNAIPWNVLYYRKNLNAFRNDRFEGWQDNPVLNALSAGGGPMNFYTIVNLRPVNTVPPPPSGAITVTATVPQRVLANRPYTLTAFVSQAGKPLSGATVTFAASLPTGGALNSVQATSNATGIATASWTVPFLQGNIFLTVTGASGGVSGTTTKQLDVTIGPPAPMALLSLSTPTPVISPTQTATVTATLVDGTGTPISGSKVTVDPTLILGTVAPASAGSDTTDANGHATFTYTPANAKLYTNAHQLDTIRANVTVPNTIVGDTQTAALTIFVQNDAPSSWDVVSIVGSPQLVLSQALGTSTNITVQVSSFTGGAVAGITVEPVLSKGEHNVTFNRTSAVTDALGQASFMVSKNLTLTAGLAQNVLVRFETVGVLAATSDQVALLLSGGVTATGYAAKISFNNATLPYSAAGSTSIVTATVYDQTGVPVVGVPVAFQIGYGDLGIPAEFNWSFDYTAWAYLGDGLALDTLGGGSIGGSFASTTNQADPANAQYGVENFMNDAEVLGPGPLGIDACVPSTFPAGFRGFYHINATSATDALGHVRSSFRALPMPMDSDVQVSLYVQAPGAVLNDVVDACNFVSHFEGQAFKIDSGVVVQRAPGFALGSLTSNQTVFTSQSRRMTFTAQFYKLGGVAAGNVQVFAVRGQGSGTRNIRGAFGGTFTTTSTGSLTFQNTVPYLGASQAYYYGLLPADPAFAFGGREQLFGGLFGDFWFSPNFEILIAKFPYQFHRGYMVIPSSVEFATATANSPILPLGGTTTVSVHIQTGNGTPVNVSGASVWSGAFQNSTDAFGNAMVSFIAPTGASGALEGLVVVTDPATGSAVRAWFGVMVTGPVLTYGAISATVATAGSASTFSSTVTNTMPVGGTATVTLVVDNVTVGSQVVTIGASGTASVTFNYVFASAGTHQVNIGTAGYSASVPAPSPSGFSTEAITLSIVLLVVGLVAGVVVGMMLARRGRKPTPAMPEESGTPAEPPAEEELPSEEKL